MLQKIISPYKTSVLNIKQLIPIDSHKTTTELNSIFRLCTIENKFLMDNRWTMDIEVFFSYILCSFLYYCILLEEINDYFIFSTSYLR